MGSSLSFICTKSVLVSFRILLQTLLVDIGVDSFSIKLIVHLCLGVNRGLKISSIICIDLFGVFGGSKIFSRLLKIVVVEVFVIGLFID